ncbi:hypothetical protein SY83_17885 [Paenibacillus swuensis]|uniref:Type II secretion system protein GspF domain-containing protein n=1 Tax=Paenibacillus swuensis TaxID=1178515 RepID=A0A172TQG4_9BACL|nr:hypothetical protein SY83_17885 [Paenibacillus swuensis]
MAIVLAGLAGIVLWGKERISQRAIVLKTSSVIKEHAPTSVQPKSAQVYTAKNYDEYTLVTHEKWIVIFLTALIMFIIGYLFYKSIVLSAALSFISLKAPGVWIRNRILKQKKELQLSFKHCLYSISSSLSAGKSVENAFREAIVDLTLIYPDADLAMVQEMEAIVRKVDNGLPIEKALSDLGARAHLDEISNFTEVFNICKRTGGDLVEVVRKTAHMIGDKLQIEQEISVMIAQKRFESKAMCVIPFVIIGFLSFGSPDYMQPLYTLKGHFVMTLALAVIGVAGWLSMKIMNLKV